MTLTPPGPDHRPPRADATPTGGRQSNQRRAIGRDSASRQGRPGPDRRATVPGPIAPVGSGQGETVLLVAACTGTRCAAVRRPHDPGADPVDRCGHLLRAAVRQRPDAVLLSTACLGPCHLGSVAAVGWARPRAQGGRLDWLARPVLLTMLDSPKRAAAASSWINAGAPDAGTLPALLTGPTARE